MPEAIISAIREIVEARGYESLAKEAGLSQKALYKILSETKEAKPRSFKIVKGQMTTKMSVTDVCKKYDLSPTIF